MYSKQFIFMMAFFVCAAAKPSEKEELSEWSQQFFKDRKEESNGFVAKIFSTPHEVDEHRPESCGEENHDYHLCPTYNTVTDEDGNAVNEYVCIRYADLCNGFASCPNGEDEEKEMCKLHEQFKIYLHAQVEEFMKEEERRSKSPKRAHNSA